MPRNLPPPLFVKEGRKRFFPFEKEDERGFISQEPAVSHSHNSISDSGSFLTVRNENDRLALFLPKSPKDLEHLLS